MALNNYHIKTVSAEFNINPPILKAFIDVETPGSGFDPSTGKILIQFEPHWFRKHEPFAPSGKWSINKVDIQKREWIAFNDAFLINAKAAMMSTSIGLGQIMGFHYKLLGYITVDIMWDEAKEGEVQQLRQLCTFLQRYKNGAILKAFDKKDFHRVAELYNGKHYKKVAQKYNREPYDKSLENAYKKAEKLFK